MKVRLFIVLSSFFFIIWGVLLYVFVLSDKLDKRYDSMPYSLTEEEMDLLRNGDIILREGYGLVSKKIVDTLNDSLPISHCGILVKTDSVWQVVHATPGILTFQVDKDAVVVSPFTDFVEESKPNSIIVTRLKGQEGNRMAVAALAFSKRKIPFDYAFDRNDTTTVYCSELPLRIMEQEFHLSPDSLGLQTDIPPFSLYLNPNYFVVVINHKDQ